MKHMLAGLAMAVVVSLAPSADASSKALLMFGLGDEGDFALALEAQRVLEDRFGVDEVQVLADVTTDEVRDQMAAFLRAPGQRGDRRIVWVSGVAKTVSGTSTGLCEEASATPIHPRVMSLILLPDCMVHAIDLPASAVRVSRYRPTPRDLTRAMLTNRHADADRDRAATAVIALPSHDPKAVVQANRVALRAFAETRTTLEPLHVLDEVQRHFDNHPLRANYRPTLDVARWHARFMDVALLE